MRILHLAFEDHLRPGSGGGSLRNREINSRLAAAGHEVDVVTANYLGAGPRFEDGVSYRQVGVRHGYSPSLLTHQMRLPRLVAATVKRHRPDVIVEEFAPLTSSLGVGHWTTVPSVGVAQGFFAAEKARQYHLPASLLLEAQRWGTNSHDHLIAVSEDVAGQLRVVAPSVPVTVIANGVDMESADAARAEVVRGGTGADGTETVDQDPDVLFLGRLEIDQKGLDVLVDAMVDVEPGIRLVMAGAGRDRAQLQRLVEARGLSNRISFIGPVDGAAKWRLLARAGLLVLPSRYETFGISPLEAMACGTPVIASDLPCLRELVPDRAGQLVPREDAGALAAAISELIASPRRRREMSEAGPEVASRYSWDAIADAQADVYASILERNRSWATV